MNYSHTRVYNSFLHYKGGGGGGGGGSREAGRNFLNIKKEMNKNYGNNKPTPRTQLTFEQYTKAQRTPHSEEREREKKRAEANERAEVYSMACTFVFHILITHTHIIKLNVCIAILNN